MKKTRFLSLLLVLVMLLGMVPTAWAAPAASAATIYDLLVSDLDAPIGLDSDPVFSWKMRSDVIGAAQTAYSVVVTDGETEVWNTGWVDSAESVGIAYEGKALQSSTAYTVTVTVKDQDGAETAPISTTFEMGLLEENALADAKFISMGEAAATSNLPAYRRVLNIREGLVSA